MFKPRIRLPRISIRLPKFKFRISIPFGKIATVIGAINTLLLVTLGSLGLLVSYVNPVPYIAEWITWLYGYDVANEAFIQVNYLQENLPYTIGASVGLIVFGLLLHVTSFKSWWRTLKATPMAVVRSPINAYKRMVIWRNWILAKITYLNEESQKWKTLFNVLKSPYSLMRAMGFSPQMAIGLLTVGATAGGGVVVNETILAERSFSAGDSGIYAAPAQSPSTELEEAMAWRQVDEDDNTLRIVLGTTPVKEIVIEDVSVGTVYSNSALPSGQTTAVLVGGVDLAQGTDTWMEIGELTIEKSRCTSMDFSDINAHTINVIGNASSGQSIHQIAGTSRMRAIGGGHHQAEAMNTKGGSYDRIHIDAPTTAVDGKVDKLTLSNMFTEGGPCSFTRMKVGTMNILLNEIGDGSAFTSKQFEIENTVTASVWNVSDNVEVAIGVPSATLDNE